MGEISNKDPWGYLKGTGLPKGGGPRARKDPPMSTPMPNDRKLAVTCVTQSVARPPEHVEPDPAKTAKRVGANKANIEGNESAKYEKLEKRSLTSLKGGGTEKELRDGHNTGVKDTIKEFKAGTLHSGSKKGPKVTNPKQAIAIGLSQERRAKKKGKY